MSANPTATSPHPRDPLSALRQSTSARHETLDTAMPLATPNATLADYHAHLQLLRPWLAPLETWLATFTDGPQNPATLKKIQRTPLIDADLRDPSMPPGPSEASEPSDTHDIAWYPRSDSPGYRWGVTYVIEGSQLGGKVIYNRLRERLSPHPLHYLASRDTPIGPRWSQFVAALQKELVEAAEIDAACAGATDTFDRLIDLVSRSKVW